MSCRTLVFVFVISILLPIRSGAAPQAIQDGEPRGSVSDGVILSREAMGNLASELAKLIAEYPVSAAKGEGLFGAMGGATVRLASSKPQELTLPIPQLDDGQVPIAYAVAVEPAEAVLELRLRTRANGDVVLHARLGGKKQEVKFSWSAIVLVGTKVVTPPTIPIETYRRPSACVQSAGDEITKIAGELWPESASIREYASRIQRYIRKMVRKSLPTSIDAHGILASGENTICTGNANLALALLRARGISGRTLAVIPTTSQRLEMHRVVQVVESGSRFAFDPSMVHVEIPLEPWHEIIMSRTSIDDENLAMKPRAAVSRGCPYGQEIEFLTPGLMLVGENFFWTEAKPLAAFAPSEAAARRAAKAWTNFVATGVLLPSQKAVGAAGSETAFNAAFSSD